MMSDQGMRQPYALRRRLASRPAQRVWRILPYAVPGRTYHDRRPGARVIPLWVDFGPWRA